MSARRVLPALLLALVAASGPALASAHRSTPGFFGTEVNLGDLGQLPEPSIAIDPLTRNVVVAAPQGVTAGTLGTAPQGIGGTGAGAPGDTALVRSRDGGRSFGKPVYSQAYEGGGDADIVFDEHHSLYLTTLSGSGSEFCHSVEGDTYASVNNLPCGADPRSRSNIEQDRPWLTRDGRYFYATNHDLIAQVPSAEYSTDHLRGLQPCGSVLPTGSQAMLNFLPNTNTQVSKPVVDSAGRFIIPVLEQLPTQLRGTSQAGLGGLYVSVSSDRCKSFTPHGVFVSPDASFDYLFTSLAVDTADNLYLGAVGRIRNVSPDRGAYLFVSKDHGVTWSAPRRMSAPTSHSAYLPAVAAGTNGQVVMGWFDTTAAPGSTSPDQQWHYTVAVSSNGGRTVQRSVVGKGEAHRGPIEGSALSDFTSMTVNGQQDFPVGGHQISRPADTSSPGGWTADLQ